MKLTLSMPYIFLALISETLANLFFDPGFDSYPVTVSASDSLNVPFLYGYQNNNYTRDYNGVRFSTYFEVKQYHLSPQLTTQAAHFKAMGSIINFCQKISPIIGQQYLFIFNVYLDPIMQFAEVDLKADDNLLQVLTYNRSEDAEIIVNNISLTFNTTPVNLCF